LFTNRFNNQNNSFLQLSNGFASQTSSDNIIFPDDNYNPFPNNNTNPFSNPIKTDSRVDTNPLLQLSINRTNTQNNSFLQPPNGNKNENSFLLNGFASSDNIVFPDNYNPFPNNNTNSFLNPIKTDSKVDTEEFSSSRPITQRYTPLPYYRTSTSNVSFNIFTLGPVFTTFPPLKNIYLVSRSPPAEDLLSIKSDSVKTISEFSK